MNFDSFCTSQNRTLRISMTKCRQWTIYLLVRPDRGRFNRREHQMDFKIGGCGHWTEEDRGSSCRKPSIFLWWPLLDANVNSDYWWDSWLETSQRWPLKRKNNLNLLWAFWKLIGNQEKLCWVKHLSTNWYQDFRHSSTCLSFLIIL